MRDERAERVIPHPSALIPDQVLTPLTASRIASIAAARSFLPNTAFPATRIVAPASTTWRAVDTSTPPSTSMGTLSPLPDHPRYMTDLGHNRFDEFLAAEAGVHRYDQDEVSELDRCRERFGRR